MRLAGQREHTGQGIEELTSAVSAALSHSFLDVDVETGVDNGRLLAELASYGEVLSKAYTLDSRVVVHCRIPERAMGHLRYADTQIRPHGRTPSAFGQRQRQSDVTAAWRCETRARPPTGKPASRLPTGNRRRRGYG